MKGCVRGLEEQTLKAVWRAGSRTWCFCQGRRRAAEDEEAGGTQRRRPRMSAAENTNPSKQRRSLDAAGVSLMLA